MQLKYTASLVFLSLVCLMSLNSCRLAKSVFPTVIGVVCDSETKSPIKDCKVGRVLTNTDGLFYIKGEDEWKIRVGLPQFQVVNIRYTVQKEGYESQEFEVHHPEANKFSSDMVFVHDTVYLKPKSI